MRVVRGLTSVLILVLVVVAIPVGLLRFGTVASPRSFADLPDLAAVSDLLLRPDDGTVLLAALTLVGWAAWASFALAVAIEVPAHLRGLPPPRLPGLALQQHAASVLVGAVVALLVGGVASSPASALTAQAGAPTPGVATASVDEVRPGATSRVDSPPGSWTDLAAGPGIDESEQKPPPPPRAELAVTVQVGDSLWSLAETHLGDGSTWRTIGQANLGVPQPDGAALGTDWSVQPGWVLLVPGATTTEPATPQAIDLVEPGDTLSALAEEHLGDADRWPELAAGTTDVVQPDGSRLVDADLIHPGWTVVVPSDGGAGEIAPPTLTGSGGSQQELAPAEPSPPEAPPGASPAPTPGPEPAPVPESTPAHGTTVQPDDGPDADADIDADADADADIDADAAEDGVALHDLRTPAGIGGLLAAAAIAVVGTRRRAVREERSPGTRLTLPAGEPARLEHELRAVALDTRAHERALSDLSDMLASSGRPLPGVRAARLSPGTLELYLVEPVTLPFPWTDVDDGPVWAVSLSDIDVGEPIGPVGGPLDRGTSAEGQPDQPEGLVPYPGLVSVGLDEDGGTVLLDLVELGGLVVVGRGDEATDVLRAMAIELSRSRAAGELGVTLVGFGEELARVAPAGRLRHVPDIARLLVQLDGRRADTDRVLGDAGVDTVDEARRAGLAVDAWTREVVLLGDPADSARHASALRRVIRESPGSGVSLVVAAGDDHDLQPRCDLGELALWQLRFDDRSSAAAARAAGPARHGLTDSGRWAVLEPAGLTLLPQRLPQQEARVLTALTSPGSQTTAGGPSWAAALGSLGDVTAAVPDVVEVVDVGQAGRSLPTRGQLYAGPAPVVQLFGAVAVHHAAGQSPASHTARATALIAYLATSGSARTRGQVADSLSPARRLTEQTVHALASRARRWLGDDEAGRPFLPRAVDSGAYRVHSDVTTDWARWQTMIGEDVTRTPVDVLVAALELVDEPFAAVVERHYTWAEQLREDVIAGVVDVAHEACRRASQVHDTDSARRAVRAGMRVDPASELLWRDLLRLEHEAGRRDVVTTLVRRIQAYADDMGVGLHPETEALVDELTAGATSRRGRRARAKAIAL